MRCRAIVAVGLAGALALVAAPAFAQHRRHGGEGRDTASPRTESRAESRQAPESRPQQRQDDRATPRQDRQEQRQEPRAVPRQDSRRAPSYAAPRYYNGGRYNGPRYAGPRFSIAPRRFYRPYYAFRPWFSVGFGIWAGYPVRYADPYYYPYDYYPDATPPQGYPYATPPQGSMSVQPNQANMGGLSFDITPDTAEVYVDGNYAGEVNQFTSSSQPLGLPAGRHHVEVRESGYAVTSFDVDIVAGQVIPYRGQLQP